MEFLGDALVNLIVAEALHHRWPKADEGALTRARASLVRESTLATLARSLGLGDRLELGTGELKTGGHRRERVLPWFEPLIDQLPIGKVEKDAKTRLQEWLQARQSPRPDYTLIDATGEEHARTFRVSCSVGEPAIEATGEGSSMRSAEQAAAAAVLDQLELTR